MSRSMTDCSSKVVLSAFLSVKVKWAQIPYGASSLWEPLNIGLTVCAIPQYGMMMLTKTIMIINRLNYLPPVNNLLYFGNSFVKM